MSLIVSLSGGENLGTLHKGDELEYMENIGIMAWGVLGHNLAHWEAAHRAGKL